MTQQPISNWAIKYAKTCVVFSLLFAVLLGLGAQNLYFRGDYKVFFEEDNPQRMAYEKMQQVFSKNETVSILVTAPEENGDKGVFTIETLSLIHELTNASWQIPLSSRVDAITNYQRTYSEDDDLVVEDLVLEPSFLNDIYIEEIKGVALSQIELVNKLLSTDGKVTMINVTVQLPDGDQTKEITEISQYVRNMISNFESRYPKHEFRTSGLVTMTDAMFVAAMNDSETLFPIMFAVIIALLIILLKSVWAAIFSVVLVQLSILSTMGLGGWLGLFLNIATVNVPIIVATIAIADAVHLVTGVKYYMEEGESQKSAIRKSVEFNRKPILLTSITTAIGFLTLNFAKVPILADMGNLVAFGVMVACVLSLTLLPALLSVVTLKYHKKPHDNSKWRSLANFLSNHSLKIMLIGFAITLASLHLNSRNELNDIVIEYFKSANEFRQHADYQEEKISGLSAIDFAIYTNASGEINEPSFLVMLDDFSQWLRSQPEVDHVLSYSDTVKRLNKHMNNCAPDFYRIPESRDLAAQYLLLYEMSLPFGLDVNNQIDIDKAAVRVMATLKNLGSKEFTQFEVRAKKWFASRAPQYSLEAGSIPLIFAHIGKANMQSMMFGSGLALILISGLLIFALRSLKLGMISLIPNLLPAIIGFAIWAVISGQISMALAVVISMTLGIIVDDTVHLLVKYDTARKQNLPAKDAIYFALKSVGTALITTTIVLSAGFIVLSFSDFTVNSDLGLLTAIIIVAALVVDLLLLPAILYYFNRRSAQSSITNETEDFHKGINK